MTNVQLNIIPYRESQAVLPEAIQYFFAKKLYNAKDDTALLWKAGNYSWVVNPNQGPGRRVSPEDMATLPQDKQEEYTLVFADEESAASKLDMIVCPSRNVQICRADALNGYDPVSNDTGLLHSISDFFATNVICEAHLEGQLTEGEAIKMLKAHGPHAMFESQKILYKGVQKKAGLTMKSQQDVLDALAGFTANGFPQVQDIFRARVDKVDEADDSAWVKLQGHSPEGLVRVINPLLFVLRDNHVRGQDSYFDITTYKNKPEGRTHILIEPV